MSIVRPNNGRHHVQIIAVSETTFICLEGDRESDSVSFVLRGRDEALTFKSVEDCERFRRSYRESQEAEHATLAEERERVAMEAAVLTIGIAVLLELTEAGLDAAVAHFTSDFWTNQRILTCVVAVAGARPGSSLMLLALAEKLGIAQQAREATQGPPPGTALWNFATMTKANKPQRMSRHARMRRGHEMTVDRERLLASAAAGDVLRLRSCSGASRGRGSLWSGEPCPGRTCWRGGPWSAQ
jgi:hypothetical protein